ncbi:hypothetical protein QZH41_005878 [Actinostola sp. cb2023]|nr:hypothetical protein QZH41_005878 [Actinostola sp. cb2023]
MVTQEDIPTYRKYMVLELHQELLHPIPPTSAYYLLHNYYAVDYINIFYIGRVVENKWSKEAETSKDTASVVLDTLRHLSMKVDELQKEQTVLKASTPPLRGQEIT